jgi:hypothetical protein
MDNILSLLGEFFWRLCRWIKQLLQKKEPGTGEIPVARPSTPFETSDFNIPHTQDEFNEASSGSGGPGQSAPSQEQKQDLKHNVAKPKAPAPPRR